MVAAKVIEQRVMTIPEDKVFTINDLQFPSEWWVNISVKLGRMVTEGVLRKIGKGRFYRPRQSIFGELPPKEAEIVKDLLEKDGKRIGYITGYSISNQMGLTTQISGIIQIGTNGTKRNLTRGDYKVKFIKQPNEITDDNIKYLIVLDAISHIGKIPDTTITDSVERLTMIIEKFKKEEIEIMVSLAAAYPARLRALLGAMLENMGYNKETEVLFQSLNPLTTYSFPGLAESMSNSHKWNIK